MSFNKAKKTGNWGAYKAKLGAYNEKIKESKKRSWREFREDKQSVPDRVRINMNPS